MRRLVSEWLHDFRQNPTPAKTLLVAAFFFISLLYCGGISSLAFGEQFRATRAAMLPTPTSAPATPVNVTPTEAVTPLATPEPTVEATIEATPTSALATPVDATPTSIATPAPTVVASPTLTFTTPTATLPPTPTQSYRPRLTVTVGSPTRTRTPTLTPDLFGSPTHTPTRTPIGR